MFDNEYKERAYQEWCMYSNGTHDHLDVIGLLSGTLNVNAYELEYDFVKRYETEQIETLDEAYEAVETFCYENFSDTYKPNLNYLNHLLNQVVEIAKGRK